ncbi:MAG: hypothetical protein ACO1NV_00405 [Leptospira bouyouniensis]|uniref:Uncharacterized protein n=1 Tax=Leptospira bouyouniensis TaxID=2484911 RepID=A0A7I0HNZ2_9LEPT|nr:hypothetical protein [Leptospira bouyouniensis]TGK46983.1 hypothetical protein EHQ10_16730 [Leptospira bouyouniensis]TGL03163.1 hypothetical protein EHQ43_15300 [Leptospira bouyouniensis]TGM80089.1 hypothetical protein EHQ99_10265 [Leptospira bouyouniensis]
MDDESIQKIGLNPGLLLLNQSISILVVTFVCYLSVSRQKFFIIIILSMTIVEGIQFKLYSNQNLIAFRGFVKLILLLPFGLTIILILH